MTEAKPLYIFVHVDADPTLLHTHTAKEDMIHAEKARLGWNSLSSTLGFFEALGEKLRKQAITFKSTFFLRADEQILDLSKQYSWVFLNFYDRVSSLFSVGWHPHLLRWSDQQHTWQQEHKDNEWIARILTEAFQDLKSNGFRVRFSKMGWCFHNNTSMRTLSDLGIEADFSALPGARAPGRMIDGISFQDRYDWTRTKRQPYHPSEHDYQTSGDLSILEIPLTTHEVSGPMELLYTAKLGLPSYRRLDFSYLPSYRRMVPLLLIDLVKVTNLRQFCESLLQRSAGENYVTLYLHPDDLLTSTKQSVFENFILQMLSTAAKCSRIPSFVDVQSLHALYSSSCKGSEKA